MRTALATIVSNIGRWLNSKLGIISDDPWYDWADQYLDGETTLTYEEWSKRNG